MTRRLTDIACGLALALAGVLVTAPTASAQTQTQAQSTPQPPLAGPPSPEQVQPWGLPPPPPGIGPVSLFADIHDQPQGKFLEGGAFDNDGNFWFVAIDSGWVSYLTPDAKLVPGFNCNPKDDPVWHASRRAPGGMKASYTSRRAISAFSSMIRRPKSQLARLDIPQRTLQGSERSGFRRRGKSVLHRSLGYRAGTGHSGSGRCRVSVFQGRNSKAHHIDRQFPNGIAVSPDDHTLAVADYASNRILYYLSSKGRKSACSQCARIHHIRHSSSPPPEATIPAMAGLTAFTTTCMGISGRHAVSAGSSNTIRAASSSATCRCRTVMRQPRTWPSEARTTNTSTWKEPSAVPSTNSKLHTLG